MTKEIFLPRVIKFPEIKINDPVTVHIWDRKSHRHLEAEVDRQDLANQMQFLNSTSQKAGLRPGEIKPSGTLSRDGLAVVTLVENYALVKGFVQHQREAGNMIPVMSYKDLMRLFANR